MGERAVRLADRLVDDRTGERFGGRIGGRTKKVGIKASGRVYWRAAGTVIDGDEMGDSLELTERRLMDG